LLFGTTVIGVLIAGIQSNFTYSDSPSHTWLVALLSVGLVLKAIPSIIHYHKTGRESREDWTSLVAALSALVAVVPLGPQYAEVGVFCGFLAKQLIPPPST
jgi:hypothetical protein